MAKEHEDEKPRTMKAVPDAPPGIEMDNHGKPIPLAKRTRDHQREVVNGGEVKPSPPKT